MNYFYMCNLSTDELRHVDSTLKCFVSLKENHIYIKNPDKEVLMFLALKGISAKKVSVSDIVRFEYRTCSSGLHILKKFIEDNESNT